MVQKSRSSTIQRFKSQNKLPRVDPENSERGGHLPTIFYSFWRIIKNSTKFHRKRGGHSLSGQSLKICPSDCRCHPSLKRIKQHNNPPSFVFCACCDRYTVLFFFGFAFLIDLQDLFETQLLLTRSNKQITGLDSKLALINNA